MSSASSLACTFQIGKWAREGGGGATGWYEEGGATGRYEEGSRDIRREVPRGATGKYEERHTLPDVARRDHGI